jgi:hypothetical protein
MRYLGLLLLGKDQPLGAGRGRQTVRFPLGLPAGEVIVAGGLCVGCYRE